MHPKTLTLIGARLIAVYLMAQGVTMLPQLATVPAFGYTEGAANVYWYVLVGALSWLVVGAVIWSTAPWLSAWIAPSDSTEPRGVSSGDLVQGGIGIVGLVIAVLAVPAIIGFVYSLITNPPTNSINWSETLYLLGYRLLLVILGILMVVFSRRLRSWIFRVRELVAE